MVQTKVDAEKEATKEEVAKKEVEEEREEKEESIEMKEEEKEDEKEEESTEVKEEEKEESTEMKEEEKEEEKWLHYQWWDEWGRKIETKETSGRRWGKVFNWDIVRFELRLLFSNSFWIMYAI